MYSYYLPDDPNPYRYSYLPKKNSFISRHYVPDDFNNDDYYGNTKNEYVLYDDFVNNNRFTAKITTNSSNNTSTNTTNSSLDISSELSSTVNSVTNYATSFIPDTNITNTINPTTESFISGKVLGKYGFIQDKTVPIYDMINIPYASLSNFSGR